MDDVLCHLIFLSFPGRLKVLWSLNLSLAGCQVDGEEGHSWVTRRKK